MEQIDRIKQLLALKYLGVLTVTEAEELERLLKRHPGLRVIADHNLNRHQIKNLYQAYRSATHRPDFEQLISHKKNKPLVGLLGILKYGAAILLPVAILISGYLFLNRQAEQDLAPTAFTAMLSTSGQQQRTLAMMPAESYEATELQSFSIKNADSNTTYTLSTSPIDEFRVTLEDGTVIHLNHSSTLYFPERFGLMERKVILCGEAYVRVAKDKRPFLIVTDAGTIQQYGTSFHVKAYHKTQTEVVLVEGSIGMNSHANNPSQSPVMMQPGQIGRFATDGNILLEEIDTIPYVAWDTGRFNFDDYPLSGIMQVLEKWYGIEPIFENPELKKLHFSGDIDRYGTITPVLHAIAAAAGVEIKRNGKRLIIRQQFQ